MSPRIKNIRLENVGCFSSIYVPFDENCNIICGANGIGKTTILDSIASTFAMWNGSSVRKAGTEVGKISYEVFKGLEIFRGDFPVGKFLRDGAPVFQSGPSDLAPWILYIKSNRDLFYQSLSHIGRDPGRDKNSSMTFLGSGLSNDDLKNWIANRFLFFEGGKWIYCRTETKLPRFAG